MGPTKPKGSTETPYAESPGLSRVASAYGGDARTGAGPGLDGSEGPEEPCSKLPIRGIGSGYRVHIKGY